MTFELQPELPRVEAGMSWFAVQARPAAEDIAAGTLASLDLETVLPKVRRLVGRRLQAQFRRRPMFPGYLFVRCNPALHLHAIRYSRGVLRVVGGRENPAPVDDQVIAVFRHRMDASGCIELDEEGFRRGDRVLIESGPFSGLQGVFERTLEDQVRVVILLEALQQAQLVLDRRYLSRLGV